MSEAGSKHSPAKRVLQGLVLALAAATAVLPALLAPVNPIKTSAMLAYALIFQNIMTGAASPPFYRLFKAKYVSRYHMATGIAGLLLGLTHGLLIILDRPLSGYNKVWLVGPAALLLLSVTIPAALLRKRFKKAWRRVHQINYLIFAGVFVKVTIIGSDFKSVPALKVVICAYAAAAALALCYRLYRYLSSRRRQNAVRAAA